MHCSKYFLGFLFSFFITSLLFAQDSTHVAWKVNAIKTSEKHFDLKLDGIIQKGWHVYSKENSSQGLEGIKLLLNDSSLLNGKTTVLAKNIVFKDLVFDNQQVEVAFDSVHIIQSLFFKENIPTNLKVRLSYFVSDNNSLLPEEQSLLVSFSEGVSASIPNSYRIKIPTIDLLHPVSSCDVQEIAAPIAQKSIWAIFALGCFAGLIALITPCVFPMIPLTVSFFTNKAINRRVGIFNALMYGAFIFLIYFLLSVPFHFLDRINPAILNNISTNVYLNVFFFLIFIVFAFAFFGFYEITLPARFSNVADGKSSVGNIFGIFFMALTLALVSFSCTGPILGSLLAGSLSSNGGATQLTAGMCGFGLALALPFGIFALFPNLLKALPKSGGWLNTVKVVLGFAELAFALKFFSIADQTQHWGLLKREIFIALWVLIGALITLYIIGVIKFPHDSPIKKLNLTRIAFALFFGAFTLYLVPGVIKNSGANLNLVSGIVPPANYSIYKDNNNCIHDLNCTKDYEEGLKLAKASNKLMLLDFTGYGCVNCQRMEQNVWSNPEVLKVMKEHFIVVSLYVDDKKKLALEKQFTYKGNDGIEKEIKTVGDVWATFETENFQNNAQPLYAIVSPDERLLNTPVGYTPDAAVYRNWLLCGLHAFEK
jgi:thiol:disulfide interchange protein DsbD